MASAGRELEPPSTDLITLTRHILSQQQALGEAASGDLTLLLIGIQVGYHKSCSFRVAPGFDSLRNTFRMTPLRTLPLTRVPLPICSSDPLAPLGYLQLITGHIQIHRLKCPKSTIDQPRRSRRSVKRSR